MRISIFGSGYVGLVQAAVFSKVGHQVTCMDIDPAPIQRIQGGVTYPFANSDLIPLNALYRPYGEEINDL